MEDKSYKETFDADGRPTNDSIAWIDAKLALEPQNHELWNMRGNFIQLNNSESNLHPIGQAKTAYLKALEVNPKFAEAHESMGYYCDVLEDDFETAERYFRQALALEERMHSYVGLARVLAQMGKAREAIRLLEAESCPFADEFEVEYMKTEIKDGGWAPA